MSSMPFHKRYHGDALTGFMPLTLEERGAYQTLLDMMYDRGGPLIDNERLLAGYMNCSTRKWRQLCRQLIDKGKIRITHDGMLTNDRAEKEIENQAKIHRKFIEAGAKGGRARVERKKMFNENNDPDQASLEPASTEAQAIPETRSQTSVSIDTGAPAANPVTELFDLGVSLLTASGQTEKHARSLIGKWRKAKSDGEVLSGLIECRARSISNPVEWLEKRFAVARYVSASGYEYRGSRDAVKREAVRRHDMSTYWTIEGEEGREHEARAVGDIATRIVNVRAA